MGNREEWQNKAGNLGRSGANAPRPVLGRSIVLPELFLPRPPSPHLPSSSNFTMRSFPNTTVDRLDRPSAYYAGKVYILDVPITSPAWAKNPRIRSASSAMMIPTDTMTLWIISAMPQLFMLAICTSIESHCSLNYSS